MKPIKLSQVHAFTVKHSLVEALDAIFDLVTPVSLRKGDGDANEYARGAFELLACVWPQRGLTTGERALDLAEHVGLSRASCAAAWYGDPGKDEGGEA